MSEVFDYVKAIQHSKEKMIVDDLTEKSYNPFLTNRALSMSIDCVLQANEMNVAHDLPKKLQFDFLLNSIGSKKRFDKWQKASKSDDLECIKEYYNYSYPKALTALSILSIEQIQEIRKKLNKGGTK